MVERIVSWCGALLAAVLVASPASASAAICAANEKRNAFMHAVEANDIPTIRKLLSRASNPNQRITESGGFNYREGPACSVSALTLAANSGGPGARTHVEGVKLLLAAGARVDGGPPRSEYHLRYEPLARAAEAGDLEVAKLLYERGDREMIRRNRHDVLERIYMGVAREPPDETQWALLEFFVAELVTEPTDAGHFDLLLVDPRLEPTVHRLLERGLQPSPRSLAFVARAGRVDLIRKFLAHGVPVNAPLIDYPGAASNGTALIAAAGAGKRDAVAALLDAGADIRAMMKGGDNALTMAVASGCAAESACAERLEVVRLLVARGAPLGHRDYSGRSALDRAQARSDHRDEFIAALTPVAK